MHMIQFVDQNDSTRILLLFCEIWQSLNVRLFCSFFSFLRVCPLYLGIFRGVINNIDVGAGITSSSAPCGVPEHVRRPLLGLQGI